MNQCGINFFLVALAVAGAGALFARAEEHDLSRVRIDVPERMTPEVSAAVAELKEVLRMKSGTVVDPSASFRFVFGKPSDAPEVRPFESRYRIDGDTVWLWGDDSGPSEPWDWGDGRGKESQKRMGSFFAVSLFAEERLGFHWVWPGEDGVVVTPQRSVVLPTSGEGRFETALEKGRIRNYAVNVLYSREQVAGLLPAGLYADESEYPYGRKERQTWQWRNRLQDRTLFSYGHAFTDWYGRFHETRPDLLNFHAADGSRGWSADAGKGAVKLCVSNPAVVDQIIADWLQAGTNRYLNVCENDGTCWCECDSCRALDVPPSDVGELVANRARLSDRYVSFWNRIARKAREIRPDVQLVSYAYSAYRFPPVREKIEFPDNIVCGFVCNETEDGVGMVRAWRRAGLRRFFFRPNYLHYMGTVHRGYERHFYRQFQELRALGMIGCDYDATANRPPTAIEFYVLARVIADPTKPFEEIVESFYSAYGAAAPEVRRYYEAVRATGEAARDRAQRARVEQPEFFAESRKDVPRTQEFGRSEEELAEKRDILTAAVADHAERGDLSPVEARRLRNLALQAEHGRLTYRFLVAVTDLPVDELKARAFELNAFRVKHRFDLPDLYVNMYRIWWGEIRYWKAYFNRCKQELPLAEHDLGGMTFDFAACSARRFKDAFDPARNVVREPVFAQTKGGWWRNVELPTTNKATWRVSFRYRMTHPDKAGGAKLRLYAGTLEGPKKIFRQIKGFQVGLSPNLYESGHAWAEASDTIEVPEGTTHLQVYAWHAHKGAVSFEVKDLSVVDVTSKAPFEFIAMPMGNLDNVFALGEGQAGEFEYYWRSPLGRKVNLNNVRFTIDLPPGVEFLGCTYAKSNTVVRTCRADGSSTVSFGTGYLPFCTLTESFQTGRAIGVVVRAVRAPGRCGKARLSVSYAPENGPVVEATAPEIELAVIPSVKAAGVPKRYANGVMCGWAFANLPDEGIEGLSRTMTDAGVTWMAASAAEETYALWRRLGVRRITPVAWCVNNGFEIGRHGQVPESDRFVAGGIKPSDSLAAYVRQGTCPVSVYAQSDFFRTNTIPFINGQVRGTDGLWSNWEPWMFGQKGCFCDKCRKAFAAWLGKREDEIAADWPANVMAGGTYTNAIQAFRSHEHAKVVRTLDRVVRAATGGERSLGFIPGICWIEMGSWWRPRNYAAEVQAIDYAGDLRWMNPWGPYVAWESNGPYVYVKRKPLCHFYAARDVRETVDGDYPAGSRPKLMALPQGFQCGHWLSQPEHISMALDCYFFNRWEASVLYYYPRGYDARYWRTFAEATQRAARYEDFVLDGHRSDAMTEAVPVPELYAANVRQLSAYLPRCTDVPLLQTVSYDKDGVRIVAVFNFWQKGEAFFDLKAAGLQADRVSIVSERGELRAKSRTETTWTSRELAERGVRLSVGASRCRVFEIRPASAAIAPVSIVTDAALGSALESRRNPLREAAARDAEDERENGVIAADGLPVL